MKKSESRINILLPLRGLTEVRICLTLHNRQQQVWPNVRFAVSSERSRQFCLNVE